MEYIVPETEHGIVHRFHDKTCFKYCGWPSVCKDDKGNLYAVASGMRMTHVDPSGKNCMWVSNDDGKTWSETIILNDSYFDDRDTGITYMGDGKMLMAWFTLTPDDYYAGLIGEDWFNITDKELTRGFSASMKTLSDDIKKEGNGSFVKTSYNYGMTWTEPVRIPATAPHGAAACKDGRLVYLGKKYEEAYDSYGPVKLLTSFDDGKTWEETGIVPAGEGITYFNMCEPHVVELPSGRLLGAIRVHGRVPQIPMNTCYITYSDDKGKTWSKPTSLEVNGLPPHLMVHSSGAVICSYGCRDGHMAERAIVSYDGGETWTEDYELDDNIGKQKDMGYPATVELSDGSLLTLYYQALPDDWHTSILYTKWKLREK